MLLCSIWPCKETSKDLIMTATGSWGSDDLFLLMTDALACWFFKEREQGNRPWNILRDVDAHDDVSFDDMISDLRASERIKNDDVTLLRINVIG